MLKKKNFKVLRLCPIGNTLILRKALFYLRLDNLVNGKANGRVQWSLMKFFALNRGSDEIVI